MLVVRRLRSLRQGIPLIKTHRQVSICTPITTNWAVARARKRNRGETQEGRDKRNRVRFFHDPILRNDRIPRKSQAFRAPAGMLAQVRRARSGLQKRIIGTVYGLSIPKASLRAWSVAEGLRTGRTLPRLCMSSPSAGLRACSIEYRDPRSGCRRPTRGG